MSLINSADTLERQNEKLLIIAKALMRKVEQKHEQSSIAYAQFERAALLEVQVQERTIDLNRTLDLLQESNLQLETANRETATAQANLSEAIETINEGFALFDPNDSLVLFNSRFCRELEDVAPLLVQGLSFEEYVALISGSRHLSLPADVSANAWAERRFDRHRDDHVVFNVSLSQDRWLQVSEHRTMRGGTVILQTDVTDIIRLERLERDRMRDEQAQILRATLDHLNQGVCIFDRHQNLVGWNKRMDRLVELPPQEAALGQGFFTLLARLENQLEFSPLSDFDRLKRWAHHDAGRPPISIEINRGQKQILSLFGQEMPDQGFVISLTDVTAERAAARAMSEINEELERKVLDRTRALDVALTEAKRANASKTRFVAAASHDLLQPLSAAKLFIASLTDQLPDPSLARTLGKAETALLSVEQIIEALLDISKLDSKLAILDVQNVRLSAILGPLRDELTPVAQAKGLELRIVDSQLMLRSDPGYLRRIVQNLITNAIRYTDHGKVLVGVRRNGDAARLEVWDTGIGIAEEDQNRVFQEFKRLDVSHAETGLGLGLAIVERACNSLNHPLGLSSTLGKGSCFSVSVPIRHTEKSVATDTRQIQDRAELGAEDMVVFLVENDGELADAMTLMIESWGAHVIYAENGEAALSLLAEIDIKPDAFLLDYQLGAGMNGMELYSKITKRYQGVPVRLISADRTAALNQKCQALGLTLLSKPINPNTLLAFLHSVGPGL